MLSSLTATEIQVSTVSNPGYNSILTFRQDLPERILFAIVRNKNPRRVVQKVMEVQKIHRILQQEWWQWLKGLGNLDRYWLGIVAAALKRHVLAAEVGRFAIDAIMVEIHRPTRRAVYGNCIFVEVVWDIEIRKTQVVPVGCVFLLEDGVLAPMAVLDALMTISGWFCEHRLHRHPAVGRIVCT